MDEDPSPVAWASPTFLIRDSIIAGGVFNVYPGRNGEEDGRATETFLSRNARSLEDIVAFGALLHSQERFPPPHCRPDTRKAALAIVESWIWNRRGGFKDIMWISGAPGVGKSAIVQTIGDLLDGPDNPVHASFFFTRGQGARELAASLPPTIAHQFTITSTICSWYIWYLLRSNPSILHEAFHSQFRKLVIAPAFARSYVRYPMVVVIDGLDECNSEEDRVSLLKLILEAANTKSIRFLISSRPEAEIETFFKDPDVSPHVDHIVLDEETFETRKDIIIFLRSEFARIRRSRPHSIPPPIDKEEWPGDAIIFRLAVYADGQFIFATLAIGYIDTPFFSPVEQLESLLNPSPEVAPFAKLDRLYLQILIRCPPQEQGIAKLAQYRRTVKGILYVVSAWPAQSSITGIATVLGEDVHTVQTVVRGPLKTLFKFNQSSSDSKVVFCHKSLPDFLLDPNRSGDFHVPENALDLLYLSILSRPPPSDPSLPFTLEQLVAVLHAIVVWPLWDLLLPLSLAHDRFTLTLALIGDIGDGAVRYIIHEGPTSILFSKPDFYSNIYLFEDSFKQFLLDPNRAGVFYAPKNTLDLLYLRVLSRPPPEPPLAFTRGQLIGVIYAVAVWTRRRTNPATTLLEQIALINNLRPDAVRYITAQGPTSLIFTFTNDNDIGFFNSLVAKFLLDPDRVGDFHIPKNALNLLYHCILSQSPPSDPFLTFTRDQLVDVLHVVASRPHRRTRLSLDQIAFIGKVDLAAVCNIVKHGPTSLLFKTDDSDHIQFSDPLFRDFFLDHFSMSPPPQLLCT